MARRVAIHVHPPHGLGTTYLLGHLAERRRARGIESAVIEAPNRVVEADLAFLNVAAMAAA